MDMDLSQLRLLVILERERNLSRAAKMMHLSQSAASHVLAKLRLRFDDPLFVKTKTGMQPTPTALALIPDVRKGLNSLDLAFNKVKPFDPKTEAKTFYIGAVDYFEFYALPQLASRLQEEAPNIRIAIDILPENLRMERVEEGRLDVFLGVDDLQSVPRYYRRQHWLTDQYVGLVREGSDLPGKLDLRTFLATPQVHLPLVNSGADPIDQWLLEQHHSRQIAMIVQSYAIGGMVTAKSDNLMCVPANIAQQLTTMLAVRIVALPDGVPDLSLSLFSHQLYDSQESIQWLIQKIQQCAPQS